MVGKPAPDFHCLAVMDGRLKGAYPILSSTFGPH